MNSNYPPQGVHSFTNAPKPQSAQAGMIKHQNRAPWLENNQLRMYLSSSWLKTRHWLRLGRNSMCLLARFSVVRHQQVGYRLRVGLGLCGTKHSQGPTTEEPTLPEHCLFTVGSPLHSPGLWTLDTVSRIQTHPPPSLHRQECLRTISWDENSRGHGWHAQSADQRYQGRSAYLRLQSGEADTGFPSAFDFLKKERDQAPEINVCHRRI